MSDPEFAAWFRSRLVPSGACLEWPTGRNKDGYGALRVGGHTRGSHRVAWEIEHGPIPDGLHVLHRCDNPPCAKAAHLFLGTHGDNIADKVRKGRGRAQAKGVRNVRAKLAPDVVAEIRRRAVLGRGGNVAALAAEYGINGTYIYRVIRGDYWTDVSA